MISGRLGVPFLAFVLLASAGCSGSGSSYDIATTQDVAGDSSGAEDLAPADATDAAEQKIAPPADAVEEIAEVADEEIGVEDAAAEDLALVAEDDGLGGGGAEVDADAVLQTIAPSRFCSIIWK